MPKGGYKIIDLKGAFLSGGLTKVDGIYNALESSVGSKPILVTGVVINGVERTPQFCYTSVSSGGVFNILFQIETSRLSFITANQDDNVSFKLFNLSVASSGDMPEEGPSASM